MKGAVVTAILAAGLMGCAETDGGDASRVPPSAPATAPVDTDAFDAQPRIAELRARTPASTGFVPGSTPWRAASWTVPGDLRGATPGAVLWAVAQSQAWPDLLGDAFTEQTTRVSMQDEAGAIGLVMLWGFMDDAVAGRDVRLTMQQRDGSWQVVRIEERHHCRRLVSDTGLCG